MTLIRVRNTITHETGMVVGWSQWNIPQVRLDNGQGTYYLYYYEIIEVRP